MSLASSELSVACGAGLPTRALSAIGRLRPRVLDRLLSLLCPLFPEIGLTAGVVAASEVPALGVFSIATRFRFRFRGICACVPVLPFTLLSPSCAPSELDSSIDVLT